ncbi:unnamed protein product [Arabis nemorensis]|uniref:Uncharacterized protein n=1 Tax=Arabis nemorensis TaxID=586526 RepID=A0A565BCA2_9BRAS|nr:unnamed protein product [Arabis nemorensis]
MLNLWKEKKKPRKFQTYVELKEKLLSDDQRTKQSDPIVDILNVLETKKRGTSKKKLSFQGFTLTPDTQLSVATPNLTLETSPFFSQVLLEFDKNYGEGN